MWYHASPVDNLHVVGIRPRSQPRVTRHRTDFVYLGSLNYIYDQYFKYCGRGRFWIYEVDIEGLIFDDNLAGEQIRLRNTILPARVIRRGSHKVR
jgi:hypothetical protein